MKAYSSKQAFGCSKPRPVHESCQEIILELQVAVDTAISGGHGIYEQPLGS